MAKLSFSKV